MNSIERLLLLQQQLRQVLHYCYPVKDHKLEILNINIIWKKAA